MMPTARRTATAARTGAAALAVSLVIMAGCGNDEPETIPPLKSGSSPDSTTSTTPPTTEPTTSTTAPPSTEDDARAAAAYFLATYVDPDGRVVRHNQGGDTVSEGQAYAMLIAAAVGDRDAFDRVWAWAQANLMRSDGMMAWHWQDGAIVDDQPASDADLDAAHALFLAARTFGDPDYRADGSDLARAIIEHSTVEVPGGRLLVAGPWARAERTINPSYFSPLAYSVLYRDGDDSRWGEVATTSRTIVDTLTEHAPHLPPDWATARDPSRPIPSGDPPVFGFDAARTVLRFALDCEPKGRALAARSWPVLDALTSSGSTAPPAEIRLDGTPHTEMEHPAMTIAAAAAATAAGQPDSARRLLDLANAQNFHQPTYYGTALIALGRLGLDTDLLGTCPTNTVDSS